ncbi:SAM-dependent methyltransferase [Brevibacillus ginsengisoli]|uniref:SAM-dependent methyltransferase n=1 Tax=Brevibacillus ginsengisoli TaxID=363854 RepID=UPI003CF65447
MFTIKPIAAVSNARLTPEDDYWGQVVSIIRLADYLPDESLAEIESFSHLEVIFYFDQVEDDKIQYGSRHPRNNPAYPKAGIFAQRGKNRPNKLGLSIVKLLKREGRELFVEGLDAVDGTPIIDLKPVMREFLPMEKIRQPDWATDLMQHYWKVK